MLESQFKREAKQRIRERFPNLDLDFINGTNRSMPDTFILGPWSWAALEFKRSGLAAQQPAAQQPAAQQPNQNYHIQRLNRKGYASFVFPENLEEVLDDLEAVFSP
ncbi:hypothetical protein KA005_55040 [bacterium]|nr:hypothetical protein [bacterium]